MERGSPRAMTGRVEHFPGTPAVRCLPHGKAPVKAGRSRADSDGTGPDGLRRDGGPLQRAFAARSRIARSCASERASSFSSSSGRILRQAGLAPALHGNRADEAEPPAAGSAEELDLERRFENGVHGRSREKRRCCSTRPDVRSAPEYRPYRRPGTAGCPWPAGPSPGQGPQLRPPDPLECLARGLPRSRPGLLRLEIDCQGSLCWLILPPAAKTCRFGTRTRAAGSNWPVTGPPLDEQRRCEAGGELQAFDEPFAPPNPGGEGASGHRIRQCSERPSRSPP